MKKRKKDTLFAFPCDNCEYDRNEKCNAANFSVVDGVCSNLSIIENGGEPPKETFEEVEAVNDQEVV